MSKETECLICDGRITNEDKKVEISNGYYAHMTCQGSFGNRKSSSGRDWVL